MQVIGTNEIRGLEGCWSIDSLAAPLTPPPPPLPPDSNENESPSWKQGASTLSYGPYKKESNNNNEHARMQHGANFSIVCTMPLNNKNIIKTL